jgi:hypothetical protein
MAKITQHNKILNHLRVSKGLTNLDAVVQYRIPSFTKRISELRQLGYNIDGIKKVNPITGQRYTRYVLVEEAS